MINPTTYSRPLTLQEAVVSLNEADSMALVGGGFLLGELTFSFSRVVDVQDLRELKKVQFDDALKVGGAVTLEALIASDFVTPELKNSITRTLPINMRNNVTIHEALSSPHAPVEFLAMLTILGATVDHIGFEKGKLKEGRNPNQPILEFINTLDESGLPYQGLITGLTIPTPFDRVAIVTDFIGRTPKDFPIMSIASSISIVDGSVQFAQIALYGASESRLYAVDTFQLRGKSLTDDVIAEFAQSVSDIVSPVSDYQGSVDYRKAMVSVLIRRALVASVEILK